LSVTDAELAYTGKLNSWSLNIYGDAATTNDVYVYTDEFGRFAAADPSRQLLTDTGGTDIINLAAVSSAVDLNLNPGATSSIAGTALTIDASTVIENAFLGDGNDSIIGNSVANVIFGERGADTITGGAGDDVFGYARLADGADKILDFTAGQDVLNIHDLLADINYSGS